MIPNDMIEALKKNKHWSFIEKHFMIEEDPPLVGLKSIKDFSNYRINVYMSIHFDGKENNIMFYNSEYNIWSFDFLEFLTIFQKACEGRLAVLGEEVHRLTGYGCILTTIHK